MTTSEIFKLFSNEVRLNIFKFILEGKMCVSGIVNKLNVTQPTVTQHLKILEQAGLIKKQKIKNWMHYSVDEKGINEVKKELSTFTDALKVKACKCKIQSTICPVKKN